MKNTYSTEALVMNESFQEWVRHPEHEEVSQYWEEWLELHPESRYDVEQARQILLLTMEEKEEIDQEDIRGLWVRINHTLEQNEEIRVEYKQQRTATVKARRSWSAIAIAATLSGLCICSALFYFITGNKTTIHTQYGETRTITLPDQSTVVLNGNSKLTYAREWSDDRLREVWLEGEAFFMVTHQKSRGNRRFLVHTEDVKVEVVGTSFNISNRTEGTRVVLHSGKINLDLLGNSHSKPLRMSPGESVELSGAEKKMVKKRVNPEVYSSWRNKKLIFDDTPLYEVARVIEDTYGLKVVFEDSTQAQRKLVGTIPVRNLSILLQALARSFDLQITQEGNKLLIASNPDSNTSREPDANRPAATNPIRR